MNRLRAQLRSRLAGLADEAGFTMLVVLGVLTVSMGLGVAAFAAAGGDIHLSRNDQDQKRAYAAAEAGVQEYFFHLTQDNGYWAYCTEPGGALNQMGSIANTKNVPQSDTRYAIELLPANGYTACDPDDAAPTMIVNAGQFINTFSIRSTGISRNVHRSIVATFRRRGFIDYLYYTDFETADPLLYPIATNGQATRSGPADGTWEDNSSYQAWAATTCAHTYWRYGRGSLTWPASPNRYWQQQNADGTWGSTRTDTLGCIEMSFQSADSLNGPSHTNDDMSICGAPVFGRQGLNDAIELSGTGWHASTDAYCRGSSQPVVRGQWKPDSPVIRFPPTNDSLKEGIDPTYLFRGETTIVLNGSTMRVTNTERRLSNASMPLPPEGLIYVDDTTTGCPYVYNPLDPYAAHPTCGNAYVSGTYGKDLTIATAHDVVIMGDLLKSGDRMLGLIANGFVRIYHTVTGRDPTDPLSCRNDVAQQNVTIWAAILVLQHAFIADNYYCGSPLGFVQLTGALGQEYRGQVGRSDGTNKVTGYGRKYDYDDRLKLREPPHFLDPIQASWRIQRYTEQVPAQ